MAKNRFPITFSSRFRVGLAIAVGLVLFGIGRYGTNTTASDVLYAEAIHGLADVLGLIVLYKALGNTDNTMSEKGIVIWSSIFLFMAGTLALSQGYVTFVETSTHGTQPLHNQGTILWVSVCTVCLVYVQLMLIKREHSLLHGDKHTHSTQVAKRAVDAELIADMIHACSGVVIWLVSSLFREAPVSARFADLAITIILGAWMIKRGTESLLPLLQKTKTCNHKPRFPK